MIYEDVTATIGGTPLVHLSRFAEGRGRLVGKLEMRNPAGSVKDRLGHALIVDAEARGLLRPGSTLIEATGGNTGIGLAMVAAVRGYRLILTMPQSMSAERAGVLRHLGAEVRFTPGILMSDAVRLARELSSSIEGAVLLDQFNSPANVRLHRATTGPEIWSATGGQVDAVVAAVGTAGTLMGVAGFLRERKADVRIVAVEPAGAAVLSGGTPGPHRMPGIGVGFTPPLFDPSLVDEVIAVTDEAAFEAARRLARTEGISAGVSSGAALAAASQIVARPEMEGRTVVVVLPDTGDRYVSSDLFLKA